MDKIIPVTLLSLVLFLLRAKIKKMINAKFIEIGLLCESTRSSYEISQDVMSDSMRIELTEPMKLMIVKTWPNSIIMKDLDKHFLVLKTDNLYIAHMNTINPIPYCTVRKLVPLINPILSDKSVYIKADVDENNLIFNVYCCTISFHEIKN